VYIVSPPAGRYLASGGVSSPVDEHEEDDENDDDDARYDDERPQVTTVRTTTVLDAVAVVLTGQTHPTHVVLG